MNKIILASKSPRRSEILENLGIPFIKVASDFDEDSVDCNDPIELVQKLAFEKARSVSLGYKDCIVLGSDTVVAIDNKIFGKPKDLKDALGQLTLLQDNVHMVYTGIALLRGDRSFVSYEATKVYMNRLNKDEILSYISTKEPFDKAGSYGIQGIGSALVKKIDGDFYSVMGLPVSKLIEGLRFHDLNYFNTFLKN